MKLYEITNDFEELFYKYEELSDPSQYPEISIDSKGNYIDDEGNIIDIDELIAEKQEAWFDTLDGLEETFEVIAENVAKHIKNLKAESDALKIEENKLNKRRKSKENEIERFKKYLLTQMSKIKLKKIDRPSALITIRNNAESVKIDDEKEFIKTAENDEILKKYLKYTPEISKTLLKSKLQAGEIIPGAELVRTQSVIIK